MSKLYYIKRTNFKILGFPIGQREEIYTEQYSEDEEIFQINIKKDYYDSEFDIDKKKKDD